MQIQYVLVLFVLGGLAEGRRVRRWPMLSSINLHARMEPLQKHIDEIGEKTDAAFQKLLKNIENWKLNCTTTVSMDLQISAEAFRTKLKQEMQQAKKDGIGKDEEKIQKCVEEEQERYLHEFGNHYKTSLICIENATTTVKEWVQHINNTFLNNSFAGKSHDDFMFRKWSQCLSPSINNKCLDAAEELYHERRVLTNKAYEKAMEKSDKVMPKYIFLTKLCINNYKKGLVVLEEKHKKLVDKCAKNPAGQKG